MSDHHNLNETLNGRINDRGFFERILKEHKETLEEKEKVSAERDKRLDERFQSQQRAIDKAEDRLDVTLAGFPEEYARRFELEVARQAVASTADSLSGKIHSASASLESQLDKSEDRLSSRLKEVEDFQSRLIGLALGAPVVTAIIVYLLTRAGG